MRVKNVNCSIRRGKIFFAKWESVTAQPSSLCCHPLKGVVLSHSGSANTCTCSCSCDISQNFLLRLNSASKSPDTWQSECTFETKLGLPEFFRTDRGDLPPGALLHLASQLLTCNFLCPPLLVPWRGFNRVGTSPFNPRPTKTHAST